MKYWIVSLAVLLAVSSYAQDENCELTLTRASEEFQAGHFYAIPSILSPCLDKFTNEQQQRANILLTQTYLLLDDPIGAKSSYLKVLQANPEFEANENLHPIDVVYLSKKFTASPIFGWFVKGGINTSPIQVIQDIDVFDARSEEQYRMKPGYQAAVGADFYLLEKFAFRTELNYLFTVYQHNTSNYFEDDRKEFFDRMSWLTVPILFNYSDTKGRYRPYAYAGYSYSYLLRDIANGTIQKVRTAERETDDRESPDWNFLYKRNRWNSSIVVGGGLKVKLGLQYIFADVRYSIGLKNVVNPKNLYVDNDLPLTSNEFITSNVPTFSYAHVDDFFRLDNASISFGLLKPLYKPRELKRARTRSVAKSINRKG